MVSTRVGDRLRIAGAVREKHAVRLQRQHVFGRGLRRHHGHVAVRVHQQAQDVLLDAEIVGHHAKALRVLFAPACRAVARSRHGEAASSIEPLLPVIRLLARDAAGQFQAGHGRKRARLGDQLFGRRAVGGDDAAQRAHAADVPHQRARVQVPDHRNVVAAQIVLRGFASSASSRPAAKIRARPALRCTAARIPGRRDSCRRFRCADRSGRRSGRNSSDR